MCYLGLFSEMQCCLPLLNILHWRTAEIADEGVGEVGVVGEAAGLRHGGNGVLRVVVQEANSLAHAQQHNVDGRGDACGVLQLSAQLRNADAEPRSHVDGRSLVDSHQVENGAVDLRDKSALVGAHCLLL